MGTAQGRRSSARSYPWSLQRYRHFCLGARIRKVGRKKKEGPELKSELQDPLKLLIPFNGERSQERETNN